MNRIRKYKNKYQVLVTPYRIANADGFNVMLGHWTDEHLKNYNIFEYLDMEEAVQESLKYPDVDWQKLIEYHKDIYVGLYKTIKSDLEDNLFVVDIQPKIMTADELKETMFNRVMNLGKRFTLSSELNDIIGYHIVNPWNKNLREIYRILKNNKNLRIKKFTNTEGIIRMIGVTSIGTNYEIVLWNTLLSNWSRWVSLHPEIPDEVKKQTYEDVLKTQTIIEKSNVIR